VCSVPQTAPSADGGFLAVHFALLQCVMIVSRFLLDASASVRDARRGSVDRFNFSGALVLVNTSPAAVIRIRRNVSQLSTVARPHRGDHDSHRGRVTTFGWAAVRVCKKSVENVDRARTSCVVLARGIRSDGY